MPDPDARCVVLAKPGMDSVWVIKNILSATGRAFDVYRLSPNLDRLIPAVAFVPGDGPADVIADPQDWGQYISWGKLTALSGLAAITVNHRSTNGFTDLKAPRKTSTRRWHTFAPIYKPLELTPNG